MTAAARVPAAGGGDDRAALLRRGRTSRAVTREDEHLVPAETEALGLDAVPAPYAPSEAAELDATERSHLAVCERAVSGLQTAFAVAGKALATISQARLYRETHATFAEYLNDRWQMSESQGYRLLDAWPVYAQLEAAGVTVLNERQARELVTTFRKHGGPATLALVQAVTEHAPRKPTAAAFETARKALPPRLPSDPDQLARVVTEATRKALPRPTSPIGGDDRGAAESTVSPNGGETGTGPDPGDVVNVRLHEAVGHLERAWECVHEVNTLGVAATNLGAALEDSSKAKALTQRIFRGLTPGADES